MTNTYLIKYGEIFLKGKNRFIFEDALVARVKEALEPVDGEFDVHKNLSRIYVECLSEYDEEEVIEALKRVYLHCLLCLSKAFDIKLHIGIRFVEIIKNLYHYD